MLVDTSKRQFDCHKLGITMGCTIITIPLWDLQIPQIPIGSIDVLRESLESLPRNGRNGEVLSRVADDQGFLMVARPREQRGALGFGRNSWDAWDAWDVSCSMLFCFFFPFEVLKYLLWFQSCGNVKPTFLWDIVCLWMAIRDMERRKCPLPGRCTGDCTRAQLQGNKKGMKETKAVRGSQPTWLT